MTSGAADVLTAGGADVRSGDEVTVARASPVDVLGEGSTTPVDAQLTLMMSSIPARTTHFLTS